MTKQCHSILEEFMLSTDWINSGALEKMHTRQLIGLKNSCFIYHNGDNDIDGYNSLYDKIKAILATREHIPNKQEAKKIRQERAKKGY